MIRSVLNGIVAIWFFLFSLRTNCNLRFWTTYILTNSLSQHLPFGMNKLPYRPKEVVGRGGAWGCSSRFFVKYLRLTHFCPPAGFASCLYPFGHFRVQRVLKLGESLCSTYPSSHTEHITFWHFWQFGVQSKKDVDYFSGKERRGFNSEQY